MPKSASSAISQPPGAGQEAIRRSTAIRSAFASGVFHTNANGTPATPESNIHMAAGITVFLTMVAAMYVFAWRFRRDPRWRGFATPTLLWALAGTVTFFLIPLAGDPRFGLAQRLHIATWLSWLLVAAIRTRHRAPDTHQLPHPISRTQHPALAHPRRGRRPPCQRAGHTRPVLSRLPITANPGTPGGSCSWRNSRQPG
jgi:Protein of unknown function (DUF998)